VKATNATQWKPEPRTAFGAQMKATDARYTLQDSSEVMAFLEALVRWGGTPANGWHAARQCLGWKLGAPVSAAAAGFLHSVAVGPVISSGDRHAERTLSLGDHGRVHLE